jgi:hypothetical protein
MSRDEACGPHFSFARLQISILSDSLDRSELLLFAAAWGSPNQQSLRAMVRISSACFHPDDESVLELCF